MTDDPETRVRERLAALGITIDSATLARIIAFSATLPTTAQAMAHDHAFSVEPVSGAVVDAKVRGGHV